MTARVDKRALCLACADLDHLVFLPAGDAALTRRAKRASRLSAVVVRFSRARKRYERQGILAEEEALERAEAECLADVEREALLEAHGERMVRVPWEQAIVRGGQTLPRLRAGGAPPAGAEGAVS